MNPTNDVQESKRIKQARALIADNKRKLLRIGPMALAIVGLGVTLATFFLPGVAHAVGLFLGIVAIPIHLLALRWLLVAPACLVMRSRGRKFIVRWLGRITTLSLIGGAYPMVALPLLGVVIPPLACAGLIFVHSEYLNWQMDRDEQGVSLHVLEVVLLVAMAILVGLVLLLALSLAVGMGLAIEHWGHPIMEWFRSMK